MSSGMRIFLTCVLSAVLILGAFYARSEEDFSATPLDPRIRARLLRAVGDPDPSLPHRIASASTSEQIARALYGKGRTERLVALDAAAYLEPPWSLLSHLVALMGARDRQVATRACESLMIRLASRRRGQDTDAEVVAGQVEQLVEQLISLALDVRLDVDIRASSLAAIQLLEVRGYALKIDMKDLLKDPEVAVRRAALAVVTPPISENLLSGLVKMGTDDEDLSLRGQAAALLCENALEHGAKAPSEDLKRVLEQVLGDAEIPAGGIGAVIACLARFPVESRSDLIDLALGHPDPSVKQFLKALKRR